MTNRLFVPLICLLVACGGSNRGTEGARTAGEGGAGGAAGAGSMLGEDCVGERGELENYFCGQECSGRKGQRVGVNCGRACIGEPGEIPGGNCTPPMKPGGAYGRCLEEGESLEAKVIGAECCEGLERIGYEHPSPDGCVSDEPPSLFVCAACGNGACGVSENSCNCATDCPQ